MPSTPSEPSKPRVYRPWPEDVLYIPGVDDAPPLKPHAKYGEAPEVGDLPRIGKRAGDPRCADRSSYTPCHQCIYEEASVRADEGNVMPGLDCPDAAGRNPYTGMPFPMPHPSKGPTVEMNTGRGCDKYGKPYKLPARFVYLKIHRFNEEVDDYEVNKSYEVDFGPSIGSAEFQDGLRTWKASEDFLEFEAQMRKEQANFQWQDPEEDAPWERCQLVAPNPWLTDDYVVKDPMEQHIEMIREWARKPHEPWPSWGCSDEAEGVETPAALKDGPMVVQQ